MLVTFQAQGSLVWRCVFHHSTQKRGSSDRGSAYSRQIVGLRVPAQVMQNLFTQREMWAQAPNCNTAETNKPPDSNLQ